MGIFLSGLFYVWAGNCKVKIEIIIKGFNVDNYGGFLMKKLADLLIVVGIFLISNVCFASISVDRIALGGISIDSSLKYVRSIYGSPNHIDSYAKGSCWKLKYGDGFFVWASSRGGANYEKGTYYVDQVIADKDNGIATPDGIKVGMKENIIEDTYGEPFSMHRRDGLLLYSNFAHPKQACNNA